MEVCYRSIVGINEKGGWYSFWLIFSRLEFLYLFYRQDSVICLSLNCCVSSTTILYKKILSNKSSQSDGVTKRKKATGLSVGLSHQNFKWLCLVAGNRYLQCDGLGEVGILDEVGGLTV